MFCMMSPRNTRTCSVLQSAGEPPRFRLPPGPQLPPSFLPCPSSLNLPCLLHGGRHPCKKHSLSQTDLLLVLRKSPAPKTSQTKSPFAPLFAPSFSLPLNLVLCWTFCMFGKGTQLVAGLVGAEPTPGQSVSEYWDQLQCPL